MTIDRAIPADIPALIDLLGELFAIEVDFKPDRIKQRRGLEMLLVDGERAAVFVARDGGQVVGMIAAQLVTSTAEGAFSIWVEDVVVARERRGQGVGRALVNRALVWGREKGATRAQLLVDSTNAPALSYYEHLGWAKTSLEARRQLL